MRGHNTNCYSYKGMGFRGGEKWGWVENPKAVNLVFPFSLDLGRNGPGLDSLEGTKHIDFLGAFPLAPVPCNLGLSLVLSIPQSPYSGNDRAGPNRPAVKSLS